MIRRDTTASRGLASLGAAILAFALAACGNDSSGGSPTSAVADELREAGLGDFLGLQPPLRSDQSGEWTNLYYDPALEQAICLTGSPYQVSYRRGSNDQVLIYLQGGGACWDYFSCYVAKTALTVANGAAPVGSLDVTNPESPFKDYSIVYAPYCDASVFTGDATVDYEGRRTFHHGLWNLSVAVDAAKQQFPDAKRVVVAGSSAGGYGTFAGYGVTRVAFPNTEIAVFNDSGPGVQNPDATADVRARIENWNFTGRIPASCTECDPQYTFLLDWALERDPSLRAAMYSYLQDNTIRGFLGLGAAEYETLLLDVTGEVHRRHPDRFKRYFAQGSQHTILQSAAFYTKEVEGIPIRDWTVDFLEGGAGWTDVIE